MSSPFVEALVWTSNLATWALSNRGAAMDGFVFNFSLKQQKPQQSAQHHNPLHTEYVHFDWLGLVSGVGR